MAADRTVGWMMRLVVAAVVVAAFMMGMPVAPAAAAESPPPVAHYPLDSATGGHTADVAGGGGDASVSGVTVVPGQFGQAFSFAGQQDVNVANNPSLQPSRAITVQAWVNSPQPPPQYADVVAKGIESDCNSASYALYAGQTQGMFFYVYDGHGHGVLSPDAGRRIWDGQWHLLVGTYDGHVVRLFVDGVEVGNGSPAAFAIGYNLSADNDLRIGDVKGKCVPPFVGAIDDVAVWDRALSRAELVSLVTASPTGRSAARPRATSRKHRGSVAAALQSPTKVPLDIKALARTALATAAAFALVLFPSQLFNSTLEENYDEVKGWFAPLRAPLATLAARTRLSAIAGPRFWETWTGFAIFTVLSAVIYGLLSPVFGFNLGSLANFVGIAVALAAVTLLSGFPRRSFMRARHHDSGHIKVAPGTMAVALGCVILSRLAHFQPGYLYGLIAGFAFTIVASDDDEGRIAARSSVFMLVVAVAAWIIRTPIDTAATKAGAGFVVVIADAILAALFIAGIEGLVFALVPVRVLPGARLLAWNRRTWALLFGAGCVLFFHVLLDPANGYLADPSATPLTTILVLFALFATISVVFWAYFNFRPAQDGPTR